MLFSTCYPSRILNIMPYNLWNAHLLAEDVFLIFPSTEITY